MLKFIQTYFPHESSSYIPITDVWSHRFNIIMNSLETDIMKVYMYYLLYYILTNKDKKVVIASPIYESCLSLMTEFIYHFKKINKFFPDIEMISHNKEIRFSNGCELKFYKIHRYSFIDESTDMVILLDMAFGRPIQIEIFYKLCVVVLSSKPDARFIINSVPNGNNLFYEIFRQAEEGKNLFIPTRLYYWQNPKVDYNWIKDKINTLGEKEFNLKYNLCFTTKKK